MVFREEEFLNLIHCQSLLRVGILEKTFPGKVFVAMGDGRDREFVGYCYLQKC